MSYQIGIIFKDGIILASDRKIIYSNGTFEEGGNKIIKLNEFFWICSSGNVFVGNVLSGFLGGLLVGNSFSRFESGLKNIERDFRPVYEAIPPKILSFLDNSSAMFGGIFKGNLFLGNINWVPKEKNFSAIIIGYPDSFITSSADGNKQIERFVPSALKDILKFKSIGRKKLIILNIKVIYKTISLCDKTIGSNGDILFVNRDGENILHQF